MLHRDLAEPGEALPVLGDDEEVDGPLPRYIVTERVVSRSYLHPSPGRAPPRLHCLLTCGDRSWKATHFSSSWMSLHGISFLAILSKIVTAPASLSASSFCAAACHVQWNLGGELDGELCRPANQCISATPVRTRRALATSSPIRRKEEALYDLLPPPLWPAAIASAAPAAGLIAGSWRPMEKC